jgi:glucitol operon activator protein
MEAWGLVLVLFALCWVVQGAFALLQSRHYQRQLQELRQRSSGYLGVGVKKNRWGRGAVAILVTDLAGTVTHCRKLSGVSVFARFREAPALVGRAIEDLKITDPKRPWEQALHMAIERIESERKRQVES